MLTTGPLVCLPKMNVFCFILLSLVSSIGHWDGVRALVCDTGTIIATLHIWNTVRFDYGLDSQYSCNWKLCLDRDAKDNEDANHFTKSSSDTEGILLRRDSDHDPRTGIQAERATRGSSLGNP